MWFYVSLSVLLNFSSQISKEIPRFRQKKNFSKLNDVGKNFIKAHVREIFKISSISIFPKESKKKYIDESDGSNFKMIFLSFNDVT